MTFERAQFTGDAKFNIDLAFKESIHKLFMSAVAFRLLRRHSDRHSILYQIYIMVDAKLDEDRTEIYNDQKKQIDVKLDRFRRLTRSKGIVYDEEMLGWMLDHRTAIGQKSIPEEFLELDQEIEELVDEFERSLRKDLTKLKVIWVETASSTDATFN